MLTSSQSEPPQQRCLHWLRLSCITVWQEMMSQDKFTAAAVHSESCVHNKFILHACLPVQDFLLASKRFLVCEYLPQTALQRLQEAQQLSQLQQQNPPPQGESVYMALPSTAWHVAHCTQAASCKVAALHDQVMSDKMFGNAPRKLLSCSQSLRQRC